MRTEPLAIVALVGLAACGSQFGEEDDGCKLVSETPLGWDDVSDLGITPQALADQVVAATDHELAWADDTDTTAHLTVSDPANPRWLEYEYQSANGEDIDVGCPPALGIDATVALSTDDGRLQETWNAPILAQEGTTAAVAVEIEDPTGTYDIDDFTDIAYDRAWTYVDVTWQGAAISGTIEGLAETRDDSGPDGGTVSAHVVPIAEF